MSSESELAINFDNYKKKISSAKLVGQIGKVTEVNGLLIRGFIPGATVGSIVQIDSDHKNYLAEVIGFREQSVLMMGLTDIKGLSLGSRLTLKKSNATVRASEELLGHIIDGLGQPLDAPFDLEEYKDVPLYADVKNPMQRIPIREPLDLGIRALNGLLTVGRGQRVAIMAGSGVGKSVLLGMIARYTTADVNVIAMVGERGREVREFIENDLGPEGMKKSVIVCVTSDQSPLLRMRGAYVATALAEYFSSLGKNVLLMMDSVTRFAMAQREIGLSAGEPPSSRGYTPSVFAHLPRLLERAGNFEGEGSVTGLYTTLVEADDMNDPIGDSVRSIVDGHIVLSRNLAQKGHFPAIDVLQSASRVMKNCVSEEQSRLSQKMREALAIYRDAEDLINIGAYKQGNNPKIDRVLRIIDEVNDFLKQQVEDSSSMNSTLRHLQKIFVNY